MIKPFFALLLLALGSSAWAAASCYLVISTVAFGTYTAASPTPLDAVGGINAVCTELHGSFQILTGPGLSGDENARTMVNGAERLSYQLYSNASRTTTWKSPHTHPIDSEPEKTIVHTLYGRIFANQDVAPGAYTDTISITITP